MLAIGNANNYHLNWFVPELPMFRNVASLFVCVPLAAFAAGEPEFALAIEGHRFTPARIEVPAGQKVKLVVDNKDATPEEFESSALKVEKVIPGRTRATIFIGPLKPGEYPFAGEFNEKTATGVVVAK
jgi:Cupredoxin-like domain